MSTSEPASHHVGTRLLFENDRVRVWEMRLRPGESCERHVHESDYLFVNLAHARLTLYPDGGAPESFEATPGSVEYTEVGGGVTHALTNTGDSEHYEILVELKGPSRAATPQEPQTNEPSS